MSFDSLSSRAKVIVVACVILVAFAAGRYTTPVKVKTEIKTVEVEKKTTDTESDTNKNKHKDTTTTVTVNPDGSKTVTTHTIEDDNSKSSTDTKQTQVDSTSTVSSKEVVRGSSPVTISVLGGVSIPSITSSPLVYGGAISKPVLGPITLGAFGLSNGIAGGSIGLTF